MIGFHLKDDDRSAVLDADLSRLEFGHNKAFGEEKTARYKAAMKRFEAANPNHEISARALLNLATAVQGEGDWVEARQIAQQGLTRFPNSVGGRRCFNVIQQIEARSSQVTTERVWNPPLPTIDVRYRNVTKIYFRVVAFDFEQYLKASRWQPEQLDQNQRQALLAQAPIKAWSADLPATTDYQERSESLAAPADIKAGSYFLIASHNDKFDAADNQVSFAEFWVSQLALVLRSRNGAGVIEGFVLNAISGEPLPGAVIRAWHRGNNGQLIALEPTKTGPLGLFRFEGANRNTLLFHATHDGQTLSSASYVSTFMQNPPVPYERTMFFTDRSLYRPGQTIRYKGICLAVDTNQDSYRTIPARQLTVIFADANGKEIERVSHQTNDYGSFNGSVTAPRDRLTGRMFLRIDGQPQSSTNVSVEEYKRPKFQSALEAPKDAPKLGGEVSLTGKATAYTGAAIDGAKVRWRVVRQVRYPLWWSWRCWWMPPQSGASQEIAHGSAITESNGSFKIQFTAKPDLSVAAESEPTFQYTISADVTDTTGETRSASRTINVGYTALAATLTSGSWLTDEQASELSVRTTTLDGEGQSATGVLKIYALKQPDKVQRATLSGHYFPKPRGRVIDLAAAPKPDPANPNSWALGEVVFEQAVVTDAGGNAKVATKLAAGIYRAKLETKDRFGKAVTAELPLQVLDPDAGKLSYLKIPQLVASAKASVEPGEEFSCVWGSGYETARAFVEVEHRGKLLQSFWTEPGATQVLVKQKIDEAMRGGFTLRTTMVRENRAYLHSQRVDVPWSNKTLTLKWEHFVSKLEPAQKETWTAVVSGPDAKHAVAELVAAMYDASLDAYQPHNWAAGFGVFRLDHSTLHSQFENQQKHFQYIHHGWNVAQKDGSLTYRHLPADIVANFWAQQNYGRGGLRLFNAAPQAAGLRRAVESESDFQLQELSKSADYRDSDKAADGKGANGLAQAAGQVGGVGGGPAAGPDLSNVSARKNLNETAFFFPHLLADKDGSVKLEFTMPEALTEWKFLGFAHDNQLRGGLLTDKVVPKVVR